MISEPLFIVGSARTGTTALVSGLLAAGMAGHKEGHFVTLFDEMRASATRWYQSHERLRGIPGSLLHAQTPETFWPRYREFIRVYMREVYGDVGWLEKSGHRRMLRALGFMKEVYPDARIIYCKRRPVEVLISRLKKFSKLSFEQHCDDLARHMLDWLEVRETLGDWIEVEQRRMLMHPREETQRVAAFLSMSEDEAHRFYDYVSVKRPEKSSPSDETVNIEATGWSVSQRAYFVAAFNEVMERYGYGAGAYWVKAPEPTP